MKLRPSARHALFGAIVATLAPACGSSSIEPVAPVEITSDVTSEPIVVEVESSNDAAEQYAEGVASTLRKTLSSAGYNVVDDGDEAALRAKASIIATEVESYISITDENGEPVPTYKVRVDLHVYATADSILIDEESVEFESGDGKINDTAVRNTMAILTNRGKIPLHFSENPAAKKRGDDQEAPERDRS